MTLLGVYLAGLWYQGETGAIVGLALVPFIVAYGSFHAGRALVATRPCRGLPGNGPNRGVDPGAAHDGGTGGVRHGSHRRLLVAEGAVAAQKEITGTISTALAAFLSSSFVAWTEDQDASRIAGKIRDAS